MSAFREPWRVSGTDAATLTGARGHVMAECPGYVADTPHAVGRERRAARVLACVNACEGIADPAATLDALRAYLAAQEVDTDRETLHAMRDTLRASLGVRP